MQHINYLDKQLQEIQNQIDDLCVNDYALKFKIDQLTLIPGVGPVLKTTVLCELSETAYLNLPQLTPLIGLAPYARESGSYKGRRSIFACRSHKLPKVALVACMRKLLSFMYALSKTNSSWNS